MVMAPATGVYPVFGNVTAHVNASTLANLGPAAQAALKLLTSITATPAAVLAQPGQCCPGGA